MALYLHLAIRLHDKVLTVAGQLPYVVWQVVFAAGFHTSSISVVTGLDDGR